jgi:hypothetical protein
MFEATLVCLIEIFRARVPACQLLMKISLLDYWLRRNWVFLGILQGSRLEL